MNRREKKNDPSCRTMPNCRWPSASAKQMICIPGSEFFDFQDPKFDGKITKVVSWWFFFGGGGVDSTTTKLMATTDFFSYWWQVWLEMVLSWQKPAKFLSCLGYFGENFLNLVLELSGSPPTWVNQMDGKSQPSTASDPHHQLKHGTLDVAVAQKKTWHFTPWLFNLSTSSRSSPKTFVT